MMFRAFQIFPQQSTGDPRRDGELERARNQASLEAQPSRALTLVALAIIVSFVLSVIYPHTAASFVFKVWIMVSTYLWWIIGCLALLSLVALKHWRDKQRQEYELGSTQVEDMRSRMPPDTRQNSRSE